MAIICGIRQMIQFLANRLLFRNICRISKQVLSRLHFGDFSYYWIVGRKPVTVRTLLEKFVLYDQIGYLAFEFLDGKLVRNEAIKVIQMADAGK